MKADGPKMLFDFSRGVGIFIGLITVRQVPIAETSDRGDD
jgi:hypothetical protein